jgi:hypothetical protein
MPSFLSRHERLARYFMGLLAAFIAIVMLLSKADLVQTQSSYDAYGWYSVTSHDTFQTTRHYDTESACRAIEQAPKVVCRQGRIMNASWTDNRSLH